MIMRYFEARDTGSDIGRYIAAYARVERERNCLLLLAARMQRQSGVFDEVAVDVVHVDEQRGRLRGFGGHGTSGVSTIKIMRSPMRLRRDTASARGRVPHG